MIILSKHLPNVYILVMKGCVSTRDSLYGILRCPLKTGFNVLILICFFSTVDAREVPDYYEVIQNPMDFATIKRKLEVGITGSTLHGM